MYKALVLLISVVGAVSASVLPRQSPFTGTHSGDGTFFAPGLGACGIFNTGGDFITAISASLFEFVPRFPSVYWQIPSNLVADSSSSSYPGATANPNNNPVCNKKVTATYQGKSVTVAITDRCAGCAGEFDLDLSPAAFDVLAAPAVGRIPITWTWN
ncbi:hypothetical protein BS47DRAFT_1386792 [Hydnum rufescens UP504]|uniref:RlpA-like protein double-psi beta-barrel domain-containing protein n=1 Tax=Hydnum rufescens UP504 TaxID=1448309 RepID=A0A9P6BDS8_9AGAM|nr:hypothetical protein BS47DRAFT_1386792 [Hydnum rufescens UP504]